MKDKQINKKICSECQGECCKIGGCQYHPKDFDSLQFEYLLEKLNEGHISIVAALVPEYSIFPEDSHLDIILHVMARNKNRAIIDLYSLRTSCASLTDSGCLFDDTHRPSGGLNLIPKKNKRGYRCYHEVNPNTFVFAWDDYQDVLTKLVMHITGKSIEEKLKEDMYNLFLDIFYNRFTDVSNKEIRDVLGDLKMLVYFFPDEYELAKKTYYKEIGQYPVRSRKNEYKY